MLNYKVLPLKVDKERRQGNSVMGRPSSILGPENRLADSGLCHTTWAVQQDIRKHDTQRHSKVTLTLRFGPSCCFGNLEVVTMKISLHEPSGGLKLMVAPINPANCQWQPLDMWSDAWRPPSCCPILQQAAKAWMRTGYPSWGPPRSPADIITLCKMIAASQEAVEWSAIQHKLSDTRSSQNAMSWVQHEWATPSPRREARDCLIHWWVRQLFLKGRSHTKHWAVC